VPSAGMPSLCRHKIWIRFHLEVDNIKITNNTITIHFREKGLNEKPRNLIYVYYYLFRITAIAETFWARDTAGVCNSAKN